MRYSNGVLVVVGTLLGWACGATEHSDPKDEQEIRRLLDAISKAYEQRDPIGAMSPFVKDDSLVLFDLPPPLSVLGYAGTLITTKKMIDATVGPVLVEFTNIHIVVDHNHAYGYYFAHLAATMQDGTHFDMASRQTDIFQRINGKWLIVHEHNSLPVDMGTAKAMMHAPASGAFAIPFGSEKQ